MNGLKLIYRIIYFQETCEEGTNIIDLDAIQEVCEVDFVFC